MNERKLELEKLLNSECLHYDDDCATCPYCKECEEYKNIIVKGGEA